MALANLQDLLSRTVPTRLGRRREDAQELIAQLEALAAIEAQLQQARFLVQLDLGRDSGPCVQASHCGLDGD